MRERLKVYLPLGQVVLAGLLLLKFLTRPGHAYMVPQDAPERMLCYAINAPAVMVTSMMWGFDGRGIGLPPLFCYLYSLFVVYVLFLVLVGASWYAVACEIGDGRLKGSSLTPRTHIRGVADLALVMYGMALMSAASSDLQVRSLRFGRDDLLFITASFVWGLVITSFYAWDLYLYVTMTSVDRS